MKHFTTLHVFSFQNLFFGNKIKFLGNTFFNIEIVRVWWKCWHFTLNFPNIFLNIKMYFKLLLLLKILNIKYENFMVISIFKYKNSKNWNILLHTFRNSLNLCLLKLLYDKVSVRFQNIKWNNCWPAFYSPIFLLLANGKVKNMHNTPEKLPGDERLAW